MDRLLIGFLWRTLHPMVCLLQGLCPTNLFHCSAMFSSDQPLDQPISKQWLEELMLSDAVFLNTEKATCLGSWKDCTTQHMFLIQVGCSPILPFYVAFMVLVFTALMAVIYACLFIAAWIRFHCSFMIERQQINLTCSLINYSLDLCVFFWTCIEQD